VSTTLRTVRGRFEISVDDKGLWYWRLNIVGDRVALTSPYTEDLHSAFDAAVNMGGWLAGRVDTIEDAWRMGGDLPPKRTPVIDETRR
jgi:hypothetical protein